MAAFVSASHGAWSNPGNGGFQPSAKAGQSWLDIVAGAARRAADYSRMLGLSRHYLDDAGLTPGELDSALAHAGVLGGQSMSPALAHRL